MPDISTKVIQHKLNMHLEKKPVQQRRRIFALERNKAITNKVNKLLAVDFFWEVYYPNWLANVVLVKKANGKLRMCVNFTDLNKACSKDSFPLPRIDQLVDSTAGHKLLTFMDAFLGYNQMKMAEKDQEKTVFVTSQGLYYYKVMPFGLKNIGATYQRLVNNMFSKKIGRNMEMYVNDMLIKSEEESAHLDNLQETFTTLRQYQMKLNPCKCTFKVALEKFLGFMVSQRGIEANLEKVRAIVDMRSPKTVKEVQKLIRRIVALNKIISKATDKCLRFFKTLKQAFACTDKCEKAFQELKYYLSNPPLMSSSKEGENLYLYLVVLITVVSIALIQEEDKMRLPEYYVSQAFQRAEARYPWIEKIAFALIIASCKLRPYF